MATAETMGRMGSATNSGSKGGDREDLDIPRALGRYLLLRRIARGGMGEVFLASTTGLEGAERAVVVKVIRREHAGDPSFIARFLDEARVQAQLLHSGVAQVLDAAIDEATGEPYAVVEFVEGRSLGDVRARAVQIGHAFGWASAVAIATLIAEALAHVHERQDASGRALDIVHRDLSPQNVMVSYVGDAKIIDFGTARGQNRRCHTVSGVVFAKPGYTAPEVANGDPGDARVDLYALGVMLWELCAGRRFLQGDAAAHMAAVARDAKSPPPIADACGAPRDLDAIVAKLCAFDRDARYLTARNAAFDLARLLTAADALPNGERGVRARVAHLMATLFPGEPGRTRREFGRLVADARDARGEQPTPKRPSSAPPHDERAPPHDERAPEAKGGEVLAGTRYLLVRELGRGASSVVYEAEHLDLGRRAALKVIGAEHGRSPDLAARFRREARALSRLSHEGLVRVDDVGQAADGRLFCVMELLTGETLEALLAREKTMGFRDALRLADEALAALEAAHAAGLVHRDIKPANLLVPAEGGSVKLLDFGLARGAGEPDADLRSGLSLFGTPEYMAPEQAAAGTIDARADLYALGCVLYEMLTGRLPFVGGSSVAILDAKVKGSPERMRARVPAIEIPEAVDELVMKALARHPTLRFQTATEMRQAIRTVLRAPARQRRSRLAAGAVVVMLAAFAAVGVAGKGKPLSAAAEWVRSHRAAAAQVQEAPASAPFTVAAVEPMRDATPTEDGFDEGDDGDLADDTLPPGPPADAVPGDPAAAPTVTPVVATPDPAATEKPRPHKRPAKARRAASKDGDAAQKSDAAKGDKAHKKRKAKAPPVDL